MEIANEVPPHRPFDYKQKAFVRLTEDVEGVPVGTRCVFLGRSRSCVVDTAVDGHARGLYRLLKYKQRDSDVEKKFHARGTEFVPTEYDFKITGSQWQVEALDARPTDPSIFVPLSQVVFDVEVKESVTSYLTPEVVFIVKYAKLGVELRSTIYTKTQPGEPFDWMKPKVGGSGFGDYGFARANTIIAATQVAMYLAREELAYWGKGRRSRRIPGFPVDKQTEAKKKS